jgi:hypothetical protein
VSGENKAILECMDIRYREVGFIINEIKYVVSRPLGLKWVLENYLYVKASLLDAPRKRMSRFQMLLLYVKCFYGFT